MSRSISFSKLIKTVRVDQSLTQKEFAKKIGVSVSTIKMWEKDIVLPNFDNSQKLINFLRDELHAYETATIIKNQYVEEKAEK